MASLIFLALGLVTLIYGFLRDDVRILFGIMFLAIGIEAGTVRHSTYLCDGVVGVVTAHKTAKRRWTLSNGDSYHRRDFHDKCRSVAPPGWHDAKPLVAEGGEL